MTEMSQKSCSSCGRTYGAVEFNYGNKECRSYCRACDKAEKSAYTSGGAEAARRFRDEQRAKWKH